MAFSFSLKSRQERIRRDVPDAPYPSLSSRHRQTGRQAETGDRIFQLTASKVQCYYHFIVNGKERKEYRILSLEESFRPVKESRNSAGR